MSKHHHDKRTSFWRQHFVLFAETLFVTAILIGGIAFTCKHLQPQGEQNIASSNMNIPGTPSDSPTPEAGISPATSPSPTSTAASSPSPTLIPEPTATTAPTQAPTPEPTAASTYSPTPAPTKVPGSQYTFQSLEKEMYAKAGVNVRNLPSTDGKKINLIPLWGKVKVTGQCVETGWYRVDIDGTTGYVSNNYLVDKKPTPTPTPPAFTGKAYIVADYDTKEIIVSKNTSVKIYPASTIKLLTAMVALDLESDLSRKLTVTETALANIDTDVTALGAPAGTIYPFEVWLNLLLIPSYGDAANVLAEGTAGSIDAFIQKMNQKLAALGLTKTHVDNTVGLDIGDDYNEIYTTASDMFQLFVAAWEYPEIREIVGKASYTLPANGNIASEEISNSNLYLSNPSQYPSGNYISLGGKTGTTKAAGKCLVQVVEAENGKKYFCLYFGGTSTKKLYTEFANLIDYAILLDSAE